MGSKLVNYFFLIFFHFIVGGSLVAKPCLTLVTPWTEAHQAPLSLGFSRQEDWSGCHFLPDSGINSDLLHCRRFFTN